ncbi:TPA: hypothetical protein DD425_02200 [Candidatus Saccharibacteria bacterium]|nr:hypothetical protein [Candidatus Saccharibacteria bacterium]|tara:strand:- start:7164 stop:7811 length:648 start_codon:yes stop_codon:yes gene_type:complete
MKITALKTQIKNPNRVNVFVDGVYRFSLDALQVLELGIRTGVEYEEQVLHEIETEGQFSKLYARSLEYALIRPRSRKEMREYLYRKTRPVRTKTGAMREGVAPEITTRVFDRLIEKNHVNDERFAVFWVENRNVRKGVSAKKLRAELQAKGVEANSIDLAFTHTERSDEGELRKVYEKKKTRYDDKQKLIAYLARQGFNYDLIRSVMAEDTEYSD